MNHLDLHPLIGSDRLLLLGRGDKTVVFLGVPSSATPAFKAAVIVILFLIQSPWLHTQLAKLRSRRTTTPTTAEVTA